MGCGELWGKMWEFGGKRLREVGSRVRCWGQGWVILCKRIHGGVQLWVFDLGFECWEGCEQVGMWQEFAGGIGG